jgi:hypothetical protein
MEWHGLTHWLCVLYVDCEHNIGKPKCCITIYNIYGNFRERRIS